ncbi:MAG: HAD family phosphatase [Actinobacteria bacterium]|nr:HAD family phosphatase [Actinomycetota bacterium]
MTVRGVIFDFGGVFIDSPFDALVAAARRRGIDHQRLLDVVFGSYDRDTDHPWHRLERGEITVEVARDEIIALSVADGGEELDPFTLIADVVGSGVRDEVVQRCRSYRDAGLSTGLLTNNAKEFEPFWRPLLPLDELFDDVVDSSAVGLRKPDPRVYELALDRLGLRASEAVFIDDAPGNVEGALAVGMRAVLIGPRRDDVPAALAELDSLLR